MKKITITAYEVTELSDKAKEKAYYKWLESHAYPWNEENRDSLEKFAGIFPVKVRDWGYGYRNYIDWSFTEDDTIRELSGHRLATYLWNNYRDTIYQRKYRTSFRRDKRIFHPMVRQEKMVDRQTKEEYFWTRVSSNLFVETYNCPLTGYCIDNSLLDPIWKFMDKPDNRDFEDLMNDCLNEWLKDCAADYEYSTSMEAFIEECVANKCMFDERGRSV